jgi:hypothetical protein
MSKQQHSKKQQTTAFVAMYKEHTDPSFDSSITWYSTMQIYTKVMAQHSTVALEAGWQFYFESRCKKEASTKEIHQPQHTQSDSWCKYDAQKKWTKTECRAGWDDAMCSRECALGCLLAILSCRPALFSLSPLFFSCCSQKNGQVLGGPTVTLMQAGKGAHGL